VHHENHDIFQGKMHTGFNFENPNVGLNLSLFVFKCSMHFKTSKVKLHGTYLKKSMDVLKSLENLNPQVHFKTMQKSLKNKFQKKKKKKTYLFWAQPISPFPSLLSGTAQVAQ
jgi:hypothetical protein